jgi:predicted N-acetyltransferase YhbS
MTDSITCRTFRKEDEKAVRELVETTFPLFSVGQFWDWKYLQNPSFDRSFVAVAEENGKVVGCNHWLPRTIKLSDSITAPALLGANIAVAPEYRKRGVGRALINFLRSQHVGENRPLMYMFADPDLRKRFHTPVAGYIPAPCGSVLFTKILNWNKVKANVAAFNERVKHGEFKDRLAGVDVTIAFKAEGAPLLCLHLDRSGVETDVSTQDAQVTVSSDMATFSKIRGDRSSWRMFVRPLLTGRLRIRGSPRKMMMINRNMWVFKEILSKKISQVQ